MDIATAIAGRRSVREYAPKAIAEQTIRGLIAAATLAPSAMNQQPWTFTVVRNRPLLEELSAAAKRCMLDTLTTDTGAVARAARLRPMLSDPAFQIFHRAPVLILISAAAPGPWIAEDCALAAENLMLTAHAAGLGTCWIGFAQSYLNTPTGKQHLGLPDSCVPVAPLAVGYPSVYPTAVERRQPEIRWVD